MVVVVLFRISFKKWSALIKGGKSKKKDFPLYFLILLGLGPGFFMLEGCNFTGCPIFYSYKAPGVL